MPRLENEVFSSRGISVFVYNKYKSPLWQGDFYTAGCKRKRL